MFPHFQKYLNPQVRSKTVFFLPPLPLSFKISLRDTSFYISLNSLGFYLSRMVVKFSDLDIVGKNFQLMVFAFLENHWVYAFFNSCPCPLHSKLLVEFFVSPKTEGVLWFSLSKFNQKIWRWLGTLVYFHLVWLPFFKMWWLYNFGNNICQEIVWY